MQDLLGYEIEEGDIVVETKYNWMITPTIGMVTGQTTTNKIRYMTFFNQKKNSLSCNLLKITHEQMVEIFDRNPNLHWNEKSQFIKFVQQR